MMSWTLEHQEASPVIGSGFCIYIDLIEVKLNSTEVAMLILENMYMEVNIVYFSSFIREGAIDRLQKLYKKAVYKTGVRYDSLIWFDLIWFRVLFHKANIIPPPWERITTIF